MHNRQGLTPSLLWAALTDVDLWPVYLLGLTWGIPQQQVSQYLTLNLRSLGFDTFETNLLTVPAYVLFLIQLIFWTWVSEKINNRFLIVLFCQFYMLPLIIALEVMPAHTTAWAWYAVSALLVGYPYIHAILGKSQTLPVTSPPLLSSPLANTPSVAITSRNAGTVRTRTVGSALYNMTVQASNIISSNIYRTDDKPLYRTGNKVLLGLIAWNVVVIGFNKGYYMWRNKKKEEQWSAMTQEEKNQYLATTKDEGAKRLDFRFAH
jgi:hypothetical protein